jgi:hypothetical protein
MPLEQAHKSLLNKQAPVAALTESHTFLPWEVPSYPFPFFTVPLSFFPLPPQQILEVANLVS